MTISNSDYNNLLNLQDFNVLDTQPGGTLALKAQLQTVSTTFWLTASCLFLLLLLLLCLALCINQRQTYHRKLKAATATAYGNNCQYIYIIKCFIYISVLVSAEDMDGRGLSILSGRVPNTNKHSLEGSNPIWLKAYENEWFKNVDDIRFVGTALRSTNDTNFINLLSVFRDSLRLFFVYSTVCS